MKNSSALWCYFVAGWSGFYVMVVELLSARILAPYVGSAIHVWGSVIFVFMLGLALVSAVQSFAPAESAPLWLAEPKYWVFPLQAIVCGALLVWFWKYYDWGKKWHIVTGLAVGLFVLALWVSPQWLFGAAPRTDGFNPDTFADNPAMWWSAAMAGCGARSRSASPMGPASMTA